MTRGTFRQWLIATTVALLAAVTVVVLLATRHGDDDTANSGGSDDASATTDGWHGAQVTNPQPRPDFTLTDTGGQPYDFRERTAGKVTLLYFGYTSCPDVCPLQMATLSSALEREPDLPEPVVVFVTTDPHRDTPEHLRDWLDNFDTDFVGLTGTTDDIHAAERAAGVEESIVTDLDGNPTETTTADGYGVGHAAQIIAYTPDDLTHIVYPSGVQRADWQADLPRLADAWPAPAATPTT